MDVGNAGCRLEGVPSGRVPFVSAPTGDGDGLGLACGMALANSKAFKNSAKVYCLADSNDVNKGAFQEAIKFAGANKLSNLICVIEYPDDGSSGDDFRAQGWGVITLSGHDVGQMTAALKMSQHNDSPSMIVAKTGAISLEDTDQLEREIDSLARSCSPEST